MDAKSLKKMLGQVVYPDGTLEQVQVRYDEADVLYQDWEGDRWHFRFSGVVYLRCYEFGGHVESVSAYHASPEIEEAVAAIMQDGGTREGYPGLVQASFFGDSTPMLTIVFQDLRVDSA